MSVLSNTETLSKRAAYRRDVAALAAHQKSSRGAAPYSLLVNRPAGRRIAAAARTVDLTPNTVSMISGAMSAVGIIMLATIRPSIISSTAVVLLLLAGYAVDSADGQMARLNGGGTLAGEWLDHSLDMAKMSSFHVAIGVSAYRFSGDLGTWPLLVVIGFGLVAVTSFFIFILTDQLRRHVGGKGPTRSGSALFMVLAAPTDYGVQCLWLLVRPADGLFFAGYAVLAVANLGYLVIGSLSRFRQLKALDTEMALANAKGAG